MRSCDVLRRGWLMFNGRVVEKKVGRREYLSKRSENEGVPTLEVHDRRQAHSRIILRGFRTWRTAECS